jgi:predicted O-methyltransferase YrrM
MRPGFDAAERAALSARIVAALPAIEGWCTQGKAVWLSDLIGESACRTVLEVGIFGGKSLIPMALAVQHCAPGGKVYGVEDWSGDAAAETAMSAASDVWWREVELKAVKAGFLRSLLDNELSDIVNVLEMSADEAFRCLTALGLDQFDLIHLDGSHSDVRALRDVRMWTGLLRPGGILVLDDIGWPSVQPALDHLRSSCSIIEEVFESEGAAYGAYRWPG